MRKKIKRKLQKQAIPAEPASHRMDERVRRSKEAVLNVTSQMLTEVGLGGVSVDEVSRRSGVAKTTIYRHWPTRSDLLLDACAQMGKRPVTPNTGSLKGDITILLTGIAEGLRSERWPSMLPSVIDAAERDPKIAEVHGRLHVGRIAPFYEIILRAKERGELPARTDASAMIATLLGPLFYRRWFSREMIDEKFLNNVVISALKHKRAGS